MRQQIIETLNKIEGNGSFVVSGASDFMPLGLKVKGINEIGFPISSAQITSMIEVAHKAPFGKGSQTILDTTVRSAWEIDAQNITFLNPNWSKTIENILENVKVGLGVEQHEVSASLYKLLIYETGDFFLPHKDSEKEAGMFGTFIIGLPSKHTGGQLFIRFDGKEEVVDFSDSENDYKLSYAAFYADCEHEIKPLTSGYRVCLVYNLVQKPNGHKIELNKTTQYIDTLAMLLQKAYQDDPLVILLGHEYTPTNFSLNALKLHDRPRAETLFEAAKKAGFYAKLGLLTCYSMGDLRPTNYSYGRRGRRYYADDDDDDVDGVMGDDIYEQYVRIEHWSEDESLPPLRNIEIEEEDIITDIALQEGEPTEKMAEGYTGNAGMTIEYWYHYGAVVLWDKKQHFEVLREQDIENQLEWLQYYVEHWQPAESNDIKNLLIHFSELNLNASYRVKDFSAVASVLIKLNDAEFMDSEPCQTLLVQTFSGIDAAHWLALFHAFDASIFKGIFKQAGKSNTVKTLNHFTNILLQMIDFDKFEPFLSNQVELLPTYLKDSELTDKESKEAVKSIFANILSLSPAKNEDETWLKETTDGFVKTLSRGFVNDVLVDTLLSSSRYRHLNLAKQVAQVCKQHLIERTLVKPQPPADWSREVPKENYRKAYWDILTPFLQSPTQQVFDFARPQAARSEMEYAINHVTIDLKMETIKKGSPHTLRLTKTQAAYDKQLAKWQIDMGLLRKIEVF